MMPKGKMTPTLRASWERLDAAADTYADALVNPPAELTGMLMVQARLKLAAKDWVRAKREARIL